MSLRTRGTDRLEKDLTIIPIGKENVTFQEVAVNLNWVRLVVGYSSGNSVAVVAVRCGVSPGKVGILEANLIQRQDGAPVASSRGGSTTSCKEAHTMRAGGRCLSLLCHQVVGFLGHWGVR